MKKLRKLLRVSQSQFARFYKIPVRTLEDWESGKRLPPRYVIALLKRAVLEDFKEAMKSWNKDPEENSIWRELQDEI